MSFRAANAIRSKVKHSHWLPCPHCGLQLDVGALWAKSSALIPRAPGVATRVARYAAHCRWTKWRAARARQAEDDAAGRLGVTEIPRLTKLT